MTVIIIEDEQRTAKELRQMLENLDGEINVLALLPSVASAVKWFHENPAPDLIFSDIQLGDGLSFEIFKEVKPIAPVIFCTAFDQYAVDAFESNSIDYLLKPLEESALERSLKKYARLREHFSSNNLEKVITQMSTAYKQNLLVHFREKIIPVKVTDIAFVYAANGVVTLYTNDNLHYVLQYSIEQLEKMLSPQQFFKANRQFIIHRNIIKNIEHYFNRRLLVETTCTTPTKIIISRLKAQEFLHWMES
jgi:two-component system, LytTR family, response regulator LytT